MVICGSSRRSLENPRLAEPVPGIGLEVERRDVVDHQAGRAQPRVRGAGGGQLLSPGLLRIDGQAPQQGPVRRRAGTGLLQHTQAAGLAGRLDDPGQHQLPEHLVPASGFFEPQRAVGVLEGVPEVTHPRRRDGQWAAARAPPGALGGFQAQAGLVLARGQALARGDLQDLHPGLVVG